MDEKETPTREVGRASRRWLASAALLAGGALAGGVLAGTQVAGAQGSTATESPAATSEAPATDGHPDWNDADRPDPAEIDHGPGEELLTGSTAEKVEAAALEAVPDGTIVRVETDDEGAAYEAHVQTADGAVVTVKLDEDYTVLETIDGFGAGPGAGPGPGPGPGDMDDDGTAD